jgi:hypothetical protein
VEGIKSKLKEDFSVVLRFSVIAMTSLFRERKSFCFTFRFSASLTISVSSHWFNLNLPFFGHALSTDIDSEQIIQKNHFQSFLKD